jgi:hypothetical protein
MGWRWIAVLVVTVAWPWARCGAAEPGVSGRGGVTTLTFTDRSPLATNAEIYSRMRWDPAVVNPGKNDYRLEEESFEVYVPGDYTGDKAYGLLVFVNPHPSGRPPQQYLAALDKHHLICVGPNSVGNNRFTTIRMGLPVDAAVHVRERYNIDPQRVYVSGISGGGRIASMLGVGYPDVFRGGIYVIGCNFYRAVQSREQRVPETGQFATYFRSYNPPPAEFLSLARQRSRHVLITGDFDGNREQTWLYYLGFVRDRFEHVTYYQVPGMGHQPPDGEWFEEALRFLEDAPAAPRVTPVAARPVAVPVKVAPRALPATASSSPQPTDRNGVAAGLLARAKLYVDNKVYDQAREKLKWIVAQYPETAAAGEARRILKEIE